jgi:hypothetical protein
MLRENSSYRLLKTILPYILPAMILLLQGCDPAGGILIPSGATELSINMISDDNAFDNPIDVVVITEAKVLLTNIQYERERDGLNQLHHTGPYAVNMDLNGGLSEIMNGYIVRDIYTKAKFQIHKAGETETIPDAEFREGTAENQRYSMIIKGTYNGSPFVYRSKQSLEVVINFNESTNINLKKQNLTIVFNETTWFRNGNTVLNPNTVTNAALIDANIMTSFKSAFKDDNKDGVPD